MRSGATATFTAICGSTSLNFEGLPEGAVRFGADVDAIIGAETRTPQLRLKGDNATREVDLIVGADGGKSSMRAYVTDMTPTYAG